MPKDPPRNQPNYKIGGDHINEYEYDLNKGEITKEKERPEDYFPQQKNEQVTEEENPRSDNE